MKTIVKTYKAKTHVSINIVLPSKKNMHITFTPLSNGTSVYITTNEAIQQGIEGHVRFGTLFRLHSSYIRDTEAEAAAKKAAADALAQEVKTVKKTQVTVSDIASAKDYLADKFGISRTMMRSTKAILAQADSHGIEFVGLD